MRNELPPFLIKGDMVRIVATARKIDRIVLEEAAMFIEELGYKVSFGQHVFQSYHQFAGNDDMRARDFNNAILDPTVKAIFCARGGYGSVRILEDIVWNQFQKKPKWIVGYSDITAIHHVCHHLNVASLHATMPINFKTNSYTAIKSLFDILGGMNTRYIWQSDDYSRDGSCEGEMVGGNLSMIYSMMGSKEQLSTAGKILFLEDLDEYLYHVDRMMMCLKRASMLSDLKGLVIGGMTDMNDNDTPFGQDAREIIMNSVKEFDYPVAFNAPFGHIEDNRAIVHGGSYEFTVKDSKVYLSSRV